MLAVCTLWWHSLIWLMSRYNGGMLYSRVLHYDEVRHGSLGKRAKHRTNVRRAGPPNCVNGVSTY